jgi:tRNA threonylcarbamoyladenosine biosynthesis protein TsaB
MTIPTILALDTATETCSVALLSPAGTIRRAEAVGQSHSERALPMVDEILREAGVMLNDLDYLAFGAGPGSFTGLRIACGLAQGLAWGSGKPVIPVGNLLALAARALLEAPECRTVLCAIDARMHEAYFAVYQRGPEIIEVRAPSLAKPHVLAELARGVDAVAGDALTVFPEAWPDRGDLRRFPSLRADAADIARVASSPAMRARAVAAQEAAPLYVRDHVALTTDERRAGAVASAGAS